MKFRSNFKYTVDGNVIFIEDLNGPVSVTNDIENVIVDISLSVGTSMDNFEILYRDSDGIIDGIKTSHGHFSRFYYLGQTDYTEAKLKIKKWKP